MPAGSNSGTVLNRLNPHDEVASMLRHAISEGTYPPHAPLPSYRELAKRHGVSVATVRRAMDALEQEGAIRRKERSGVFPVDLQTAPVAKAGGRRLSVVTIVGDALPEVRPHVRADYLEGYTDALDETECRMRFSRLPDEAYDRIFLSRVPLEEQGVVLVNRCEPQLIEWLRARNVPFVVQYYARFFQESAPDFHCVYINKTAAAFDATNHLVGLGHRRIAFIGPADSAGSQPGGRVFQGFASAMNYAGLPVDSRCVVDRDLEDQGVLRKLATELLKSERPDAIMCSNDAAALASVRAARKLGIEVPEALSVVGINNQPEAVACEPPLTTVSVPRRTLARAAVEMLLAAAAGEFESPQTRILKCQLVVRGSTVPATE